MKHFLPAFLLLAFTGTLSAQVYKIDTVVNESWTNNSWQLASRIIYTYNNSCQLVTTTIQARDGSAWVNQLRTNYTYTGSNQVSQEVSQQWNTATSTWNNVSRLTFTYNASSKVLTTVADIWTGAAWMNATRTTNTYDSNGYLLTTLNEISLGGVLWTNQTLDTYTNNSDGTVSTHIRQNWNLVTSGWDNYLKDIYTYNPDKTIQQSVSQTWNGAAWVNSQRFTYTYDAQGRELTVLTEKWVTNAWVNDTKITNSYNGSGQLTNTLDQTWDANTWKNTEQTSYTYNANGSVHQIVTQVANEAMTELVNSTRSTFHYTENCILPLSLLDLTAELSGKDVLLKWTTAKEVNTSYFDIESSSDAAVFNKIGTVKAAGSHATTSYRFVDANPAGLANNKIFYRLKMTDNDGKSSHSKIVFVTLLRDQQTFSVFPNTVKDNLFIRYNTSSTGNAGISITDQAGRRVYNRQLSIQQVNNQYNIDVSKLNAGLYYIRLITSQGTMTSKFVKD